MIQLADYNSLVNAGKDSDYDLVNLGLGLIGLVISIAFAFYGYQSSDLGLLVTGLLFFMLLIAGIVLSKQTVLESGADLYQGSLAYWLAQLPLYLLLGFSGLQFSAVTQPSNAYLSTVISQVSTPVKRIVNEVLAPIGENFAIFGLIVVIYKMATAQGASKIQALAISVTTGSIVFATLHGVRRFTFFVLAFVVMSVMAGSLVAEDVGLRQFNYVIVTVGATIGFHRAWNQLGAGGPISFYETVLQAQPPVIYLVYPILLFDLLTLAIVVVGTVSYLRQGKNPLPT